MQFSTINDDAGILRGDDADMTKQFVIEHVPRFPVKLGRIGPRVFTKIFCNALFSVQRSNEA